MTSTSDDFALLERAVALATEALDSGDDPFGSVLVTDGGTILAGERNREVSSADPTAHPELALARWAAANLPASARGATTVYTSGEHCPMCAAAHAWVGLGRVVYAASSAQLAGWRAGWDLAPSPVAALPINAISPGIPVVGPVSPLDEAMRLIHGRAASR